MGRPCTRHVHIEATLIKRGGERTRGTEGGSGTHARIVRMVASRCKPDLGTFVTEGGRNCASELHDRADEPV